MDTEPAADPAAPSQAMRAADATQTKQTKGVHMELDRRDFFRAAGVVAAASMAMGVASAATADQPAKEEEPTVDPTTVELSEELAEVEDNINYRSAEGYEPAYPAQIVHVFGANSLMDYYLFDGYSGIGIDEKNDRMKMRDLVFEPAGGELASIVCKDGSEGDLDSLVRDVRGAVYTTADGDKVNIKCQTLHGGNPKYDGMVVFTKNMPGNFNKSLKVPLTCFDGPLTRGMNYILGNPDSGKHNTESREVDGIDETTINFHHQPNDEIKPGLQHVYTKYQCNGPRTYWLYIESANRFDVRTTAMGSSSEATDEGYIPGTALNMSVREPEGGYHATATADPVTPGRLAFSIPIADTFYFDTEDPTVCQNDVLTNEREFAFWKAEVGELNEALQGDVQISVDIDKPTNVFFSIQCDEVVPGDVELAVSVSAGRGTGWPTEWSEKPAIIKIHVE